MFARIRWTLVVAGLTSSSCGLFADERQTDGEVCSVDDECSTGVCTSLQLCSHSRCECPSGNCAKGGEQTSDCLDGWVCVGYDSIFDPVKEFFGGKANPSDGYCQPSCAAGCPEHYLCDSDQCKPDASWVTPMPTVVWTGPVTGELSGHTETLTVEVEEGSIITLTGSASSPVGAAIVSSSWVTVSAESDFLELDGASIQTTIPTGAGNYRRVEFTAVDDQHRSAQITVIFEGCIGAGGTCGHAGSGCCSGCESASNTCQ